MKIRKNRIVWKSVLLFLSIMLCSKFIYGLLEEGALSKLPKRKDMIAFAYENAIYQSSPLLYFMEDSRLDSIAERVFCKLSPLYAYTSRKEKNDAWKESKIVIEEVEDFSLIRESTTEKREEKSEEEVEDAVMIEEIVQEAEKEDYAANVKLPAVLYTKEQLQDPEFILKTFFTVDPTTNISLEQLSYDKLLGYDASMQKTRDKKPQILIYHTHSQETFADSVPGDATTSIVAVGERLAQILSKEYGYCVLHHMGEYDKESRDYAYANAAKGLEKVLAENPTIEVIIDVHRDAVKEDTHLVKNVDGIQMAQFMFFNGMSYTNAMGHISRLPNPYIQENLSFAFQLKVLADEYYPGLTRKTYLKGYRYNMQYRPRSLLIEIGAQNNTVEEAKASCEPIAYLLSLVLTGKNRQ